LSAATAVARVRSARYIPATALVLICVLWSAHAAFAGESVSLKASLTPEQLGRGTTIGVNIHIKSPVGPVPPALTSVQVLYPEGLGIALSGIGIETCTAKTLEALGAPGCPVDSLMGMGSAYAEVPFDTEPIREGASVRIFRAPDREGHLSLIFYTEAVTPVFAQLVFPGALLPAPRPFGGSVSVDVPLVETFPDGPLVGVIAIKATMGPKGLVYTKRVKGRMVRYTPRGLPLPDRCPGGGFPFAAILGFVDGSSATAHSVVACPTKRHTSDLRGPKIAKPEVLRGEHGIAGVRARADSSTTPPAAEHHDQR
jgi:hypothetical protein